MTPNFTAIGHFCSLRIGLCFYPMARERGRPPLRLLNPATLESASLRVGSREAGT
jgi:hypothetical protein